MHTYMYFFCLYSHLQRSRINDNSIALITPSVYTVLSHAISHSGDLVFLRQVADFRSAARHIQMKLNSVIIQKSKDL